MSMARVQARGQVTVPHEIREACGVEPGSELLFVPIGPQAFECRVLPPQRSLAELVARYTVDDVAPNLQALREEMGDAIARERLAANTGAHDALPQ